LEPYVGLTPFLNQYMSGDEGFPTRYCALPNSLREKIWIVSTGRSKNIPAVVW